MWASALDGIPPVSVLKPVFGSPPHLYECLRSFCDQDWPTHEVIFGAHSDGDPAVAVVQRLIREFPDSSLRLVVDGSLVGSNRKVSNLAPSTSMIGSHRQSSSMSS